MTSITSRRHFKNFYLLIFGLFLSGSGVGVLVIFEGITQRRKTNASAKHDFLIIFGAAIVVFCYYIIYEYIKAAKSVSLKENTITINNKIYQKDDIESIEFTGRHKFGGFLFLEGMKIIFKDGTVKYIFDNIFSNSSLLKQYIRHLWINSNAKFSPIRINTVKPSSRQHYYPYKGNFWLSARGCMLIIFSVFPILAFQNRGSNDTLLLLTLPPFFLLIFSGQFTFFEMNENYFVVKSHVKFWKHEIYNIEEIEEIVFESNGKAPNSCKLILKDYRTKFYYASTLSDSTWEKLGEDLQKQNINVRNKL